MIRVFSSGITLALFGFAVAFLPATINLNISKNSTNCHIQTVTDLGWFERNGVLESPTLILYKRVSADYKTQEGTSNETVWEVGSKLTHPNWNPYREECGAGKFHACSRPYFCDEFRSKRGDLYIAISIKREDLHEWSDSPNYPYKIAFREGTVLYVCNRFGKEVV